MRQCNFKNFALRQAFELGSHQRIMFGQSVSVYAMLKKTQVHVQVSIDHVVQYHCQPVCCTILTLQPIVEGKLHKLDLPNRR